MNKYPDRMLDGLVNSFPLIQAIYDPKLYYQSSEDPESADHTLEQIHLLTPHMATNLNEIGVTSEYQIRDDALFARDDHFLIFIEFCRYLFPTDSLKSFLADEDNHKALHQVVKGEVELDSLVDYFQVILINTDIIDSFDPWHQSQIPEVFEKIESSISISPSLVQHIQMLLDSITPSSQVHIPSTEIIATLSQVSGLYESIVRSTSLMSLETGPLLIARAKSTCAFLIQSTPTLDSDESLFDYILEFDSLGRKAIEASTNLENISVEHLYNVLVWDVVRVTYFFPETSLVKSLDSTLADLMTLIESKSAFSTLISRLDPIVVSSLKEFKLKEESHEE